MGSIRFRLTAIYSLVLFGVASLVILGIYLWLANRLNNQEVETYTRYVQTPDGVAVQQWKNGAQLIAKLANQRSLDLLRAYSFTALGILFVASLVIGWFVAGRVLAPIGRITAVARDIQATDLSRRIALHGPPDEITELAETFDAMLSRLDDAFEGQRRFIQETSHELRNPLAVIRTNLDVALDDPDADPAEVRRAAELVRRTASRMSRLVDDLLAYARSGAPIHELTEVDVAGVVAEAAEDFAAPAMARQLRLEAAAEPGLWVRGDRGALRQAAANLLTNAVRLAPSGSRIRIGAGRQDRWIWMVVDDEGPGIPAEQRELVFKRFWRGSPSSAGEEGRSGLGLAIVEQIARDHRGAVGLAPSPVGGSVFTIWLPAADPPAPTPPPPPD
jgi:signal transduction histidine kinase